MKKPKLELESLEESRKLKAKPSGFLHRFPTAATTTTRITTLHHPKVPPTLETILKQCKVY